MRYHDYVRDMYRNTQASLPLPATGTDLPLEECKSDLERFGMTTCGHCGKLIEQRHAIVKVYYTQYIQEQEHFCSEDCKHTWYLARLKRAGM